MAIVDYLILTPLDEEWRTASQILAPYGQREVPIDPHTYYLWRSQSGRPSTQAGEYLVVGATMSNRTPGQSAAASLSTIALGHWRPDRVTVLGIAGSLEPDRIHLGDVIVPDQVVGYEVGDAEDSGVNFRPTWNQTGALDLNRVRAFLVSPTDYPAWQAECLTDASALGLTPERAPELHIGFIASGNNVVKSEEFAKKLRSIDWRICAVEMEARGVHQALHQDAHRTDALSIRGISDYADKHKEELDAGTHKKWRKYATANAARLQRALWRRGHAVPLSPPYSLDLATGSLLDFRRPRNPPIPSIDFRIEGAQDLSFPKLLVRNGPNPSIHIQIAARRSGELAVDERRAQIILEQPSFQVVPGAERDGEIHFDLPATEAGLRCELQVCFKRRIDELSISCSDDFDRVWTGTWTNPASSGGANDV